MGILIGLLIFNSLVIVLAMYYYQSKLKLDERVLKGNFKALANINPNKRKAYIIETTKLQLITIGIILLLVNSLIVAYTYLKLNSISIGILLVLLIITLQLYKVNYKKITNKYE